MLRTALDGAQLLLLVSGQRSWQPHEQRASEPNDRVERCPKFMRHAGEEQFDHEDRYRRTEIAAPQQY